MKKRVVFALFLLVSQISFGQQREVGEPDESYKPLTLRLNDEGTKYIRFISWLQVWGVGQKGQNEDDAFRFTPLVRRARLLTYAQISPRFLILTHFGLNNLNSANMTISGVQGNGPQIFLHDAWAEFKVLDALYIGGGLHYWNGLSRLTNSSTLNFLTLDAPQPFFGWHALGRSDQFARHLGIYAKGEIGKLAYMLAVNDALVENLEAGVTINEELSMNTRSVYNDVNESKGRRIVNGYFKYQFLDKESSKLPYAVGSYFGSKDILNLGFGFHYHRDGLIRLNQTGLPTTTFNELETNTTRQDAFHFAVDAFMDRTISGGENGTAITALAAYYRFDYGGNYFCTDG
jgi:hypothetical protein